jgi:L-alanine-DL-glutamate epimerase-like enolase superfamily enzyme
MKITAVDRIVLDVPFRDEPQRNMARAHAGWHVSELIRVETDQGLVGWGETLPNYTYHRVSDEAVQRVIGRNPVEVMWDDMLGCGLQMALFDVAAKRLDVPMHRLFGRQVREHCPIGWWSIDMPPRDFQAEAKNAIANGYTGYKLKARPWFDIVEQVRAVCEVIPETFHLDVDFNGLLIDAAAAVPVLKELEKFHNVVFFESPIPQHDVAGNKRVREQTRCGIAMHYGSPPIETALREDVCDGFVIGGGASRVLREAHVAAQWNKPFWLQLVGTGVTTAWAVQLGAVCTHARWPAITCLNMYDPSLLKRPFEVEGGYIRVPDAPGLGVEVDEALFERLRVPTTKKENLAAYYAVLRPNGERTYYWGEDQYREDFLAGNQPVFERGVTLETYEDDGSPGWRETFERVKRAPVRSRSRL